MTCIDAHQHYWNPARGDYGWMPPSDPILSRVYGPHDLRPHLDTSGIDHTVIVQAAASLEETEYILGIADVTPHVAGVVGWIDFEDRQHQTQMIRLARHPKLKGFRPMIQNIPDINWMLRDEIRWGYETMTELGLGFDALGFPRHLDNFLKLFLRHPDMRVVVDHCMKPQIAEHSTENFVYWSTGIARIATETNAYCKLSGLITEANENWTIDELRPYISHVIDIFGPDRIMWGSDWPVCRLRSEYDRWHHAALELTSHLSIADRAQIFGKTAIEFYRLEI